MRIFVGYHYGPGDAWVKDHIYRLVKAFGDEVESGERLYLGPNLAAGIISKIEDCDALIGVASRDQLVNGFYTTHPWVRDELAVAKANNKCFVQLRENGLDPRLGILEGAQYIEYDAANLAECLVRLAEAIGQWHTLQTITPYLVPPEFATAVGPLLSSAGWYCRFKISDQRFNEKLRGETKIVPRPGRLEVVIRGIPRGYHIQLEAGSGAQQWISDVVSVDSPAIFMKPA